MKTIEFENKYYSTDAMLREYIDEVICKKIKIEGCLFGLLAVVMLGLTLLRHHYIMSAIFGVCLFIIILITLLTPWLTFKQTKENENRIHNGNKYETTVQFGERIAITEGKCSLSIEYEQVIKMHELSKSLVLMFGKHNGILLNPENFTKGDKDAFKAFIEEKCINLNKK